jgi:hypothetical protein
LAPAVEFQLALNDVVVIAEAELAGNVGARGKVRTAADLGEKLTDVPVAFLALTRKK